MTDTVVIAEEGNENTGYRFSWGLAIAGGVAATAVTFFLLSLGSGFGLLLVNPVAHSGPSTPSFLTGGAIYFLAAQAFGFAVGGHLAGRLMGPLVESRIQEEFRASAHGLIAWAVAVLATLTVVALAGLTLASTGATTAALYGAFASKADVTPSAYLVDVLFRPGPGGAATDVVPTPATGSMNRPAATPSGASNPPVTMSAGGQSHSSGDANARAEAGRILDAGLARGEQLTADDRNRLAELVATQASISTNEADGRVDGMQTDVQVKTRQAADIARKIASYASLWIAFSLLFGGVVSVAAAIAARNEDDREAVSGAVR